MDKVQTPTRWLCNVAGMDNYANISQILLKMFTLFNTFIYFTIIYLSPIFRVCSIFACYNNLSITLFIKAEAVLILAAYMCTNNKVAIFIAVSSYYCIKQWTHGHVGGKY